MVLTISDDLEDLMMAHLSEHLRSNKKDTWALIRSSKFSEAIKLVIAGSGTWANTLLSQYVTQIKTFDICMLYFLVHVHGNHWITAGIDFDKKEIVVGTRLEILQVKTLSYYLILQGTHLKAKRLCQLSSYKVYSCGFPKPFQLDSYSTQWA